MKYCTAPEVLDSSYMYYANVQASIVLYLCLYFCMNNHITSMYNNMCFRGGGVVIF